jgi:hypothetical protein
LARGRSGRRCKGVESGGGQKYDGEHGEGADAEAVAARTGRQMAPSAANGIKTPAPIQVLAAMPTATAWESNAAA